MSLPARRTLKNTLLLIGFEVANPLLSLLLIGVMSRRLGPEGLGAYNLLLTFFFVAHSFTSLGLNSLITREVSRKTEATGGYLCTSAALGLMMSMISAAGLIVTVHLAHYSEEIEKGSLFIGLSLLPSIVILYSESIFIAYEKVQYIVYLALLENAARVVTGLWLLRNGFGVVALIGSFALFRYVALAFNLSIFHRQIGHLAFRFDEEVARYLLRNVPVFGTIFIAASLYSRADVFLLSKLTTLAAVGYYTAAYRLFAISQVVPKSLNTSIYPIFAKRFVESPRSFQKANSVAIRYLMVVIVPVAAGVCALAEPVVRALFGAEFGPAVSVLRIVIWTLVPYGIVRVCASGLFASDRQLIDLKVNLMALASNLILNIVLIPRYGGVGCAWATLLSMLLFLAFQVLFLGSEIVSVLREAEVHRALVAAAAMWGWLWLSSSLGIGVRVVGGGVVYVAFLFLLRVVRLGELRAMLPARLVGLRPGRSES